MLVVRLLLQLVHPASIGIRLRVEERGIVRLPPQPPRLIAQPNMVLAGIPWIQPAATVSTAQ